MSDTAIERIKGLVSSDQIRYARRDNLTVIHATEAAAAMLRGIGIMSVKLPAGTGPMSQWFDHTQYPYFVRNKDLAHAVGNNAQAVGEALQGIQHLPAIDRGPDLLDETMKVAEGELGDARARLARLQEQIGRDPMHRK